MAVYGQTAIQRRLEDDEDELLPKPAVTSGLQAPNSTQAIQARGNVVYNGGFSAANNQQDQFQVQPYAFGGQVGQFQGGNQPRGYDFNADFEAGVNQLNQQKSQLQNVRESILRRLSEDYQRFGQGLDRQHEQVLDRNTQNMADRGILRSGINIGEQQEIGREYGDQVNWGAREFARGQEDVEGNYAQGLQQLHNFMEQLERDRAKAQAQADEQRARQAAELKAREEAERRAEEERARLEREIALREQQMEEMRRLNARPQPSPTGRYPYGGGGGGLSQPQPRQVSGGVPKDLQRVGANVLHPDGIDPRVVDNLLKNLSPTTTQSQFERELRQLFNPEQAAQIMGTDAIARRFAGRTGGAPAPQMF